MINESLSSQEMPREQPIDLRKMSLQPKMPREQPIDLIEMCLQPKMPREHPADLIEMSLQTKKSEPIKRIPNVQKQRAPMELKYYLLDKAELYKCHVLC